jgi:hypothetical protein
VCVEGGGTGFVNAESFCVAGAQQNQPLETAEAVKGRQAGPHALRAEALGGVVAPTQRKDSRPDSCFKKPSAPSMEGCCCDQAAAPMRLHTEFYKPHLTFWK